MTILVGTDMAKCHTSHVSSNPNPDSESLGPTPIVLVGADDQRAPILANTHTVSGNAAAIELTFYYAAHPLELGEGLTATRGSELRDGVLEIEAETVGKVVMAMPDAIELAHNIFKHVVNQTPVFVDQLAATSAMMARFRETMEGKRDE